MARKADDSLPYGSADVHVENFSSLRNSNNLPPELKAAVVDIASRISGADASSAEELLFTIKRDKLGALSIGKSGFEELAGVPRCCPDGDVAMQGKVFDDGAPDGPGGAGDEDGPHGRRPVTTTARPGSSRAPLDS